MHRPPGHRGPLVFHWEQSPEHNGFRVRTAVPRNCVETMWDSYGSKQRRYNGFLNEWDICTDFDLQDITDHEQFEDYIGSNDYPIPHNEPPHSLTHPSSFLNRSAIVLILLQPSRVRIPLL